MRIPTGYLCRLGGSVSLVLWPDLLMTQAESEGKVWKESFPPSRREIKSLIEALNPCSEQWQHSPAALGASLLSWKPRCPILAQTTHNQGF